MTKVKGKLRVRTRFIPLLYPALTFVLLHPGRADSQTAAVAKPVKTALVRTRPIPARRLEPLIPNFNYPRWFTAETRDEPHAATFGAWVIEPLGARLYLGFGSAQPCESDGALLASFDGTALKALASLPEQGIHDMTGVGETLFVSGTDPSKGDTWLAGNVYTYTPPSSFKKHRNLPRVIHTFGLWVDPKNSRTVYAAAGRLRGLLDLKSQASILKSSDQCRSWRAVKDFGESTFRAYDVVGCEGRVFALINDSGRFPCSLHVTDDDVNWKSIEASKEKLGVARLIVKRKQVIAVGAGEKRFYAFSSTDASVYPLPRALQKDDVATVVRYNINVLSTDGTLYSIVQSRKIIRTRDLINWEVFFSGRRRFLSIAYWPRKNWLILATAGKGGGLWKIDLARSPRKSTSSRKEKGSQQ